MKDKIAIIGLGYVGLPLSVEFSNFYDTIGYDINTNYVRDLSKGIDKNKILQSQSLLTKKNLRFSSLIEDIAHYNIYIITVPTPITKSNQPDLSFLLTATEMISTILDKGNLVIFESTVFPGCTEEYCIPILEKSKLKLNIDFFVGYSPERINPGDKFNTLTKIVKVTSGSNHYSSNLVDNLYKKIIKAGTFKASSIKVAEASKSIENAQRDLNISFVNELSLIFDKLKIDTYEVLEAASTKWNFMKFTPGLVGGHCISVDPYYLTHKSEIEGYIPEVILSGRKVNNLMPKFIAHKTIKLLMSKNKFKDLKILILGITFKENCSDIRNSKIPLIYNELLEFNINVDVYDHIASPNKVFEDHRINLLDKVNSSYNCIIIAVPHDNFISFDYNKHLLKGGFIFDLKNLLKDKKTIKL